MTQIYFVRHAESFGNLARRVYGWFDGRVTPRGFTQISALLKRFEDIKIDAVYSSDLIRACETARAIYAPKGLPLHREPAFREIGFGVWEDCCWGELVDTHAAEYSAWVERPLDFKVDGSETYADVYRRAKTALLKVISENEGKSIAIVSHGAVLRMLMYGIVNSDSLNGVEAAEWGDNTSVSCFNFDGEKFIEVFKNSDDHLKALPGYDEGMSWVREGGGRNVFFTPAEFDRDIEKIHTYHKLASKEIFGDDMADMHEVDRRARRLLKKNPQNIVFAHLPEKEIGAIELDPSVRLYPKTGHVSFLYLAPEYRRMRYGIQLLGHAMSKYKKEGKVHISVRVAETNAAARSFYDKYGFYEVFRENDGGIIQRVMVLDI